MKNLFIVISILSFVGLGSCSKNSPLSPNCLSGSWVKNVQTELDTWTTASMKYSDDPIKENCESNKQVGLDYISALNKIKNCVPSGSSSDFEEAQAEATEEINATSCD